VLGLTFKENCPDLRNSRVVDVIRELESYGAKVHIHDPIPDATEARHEYGFELKTWSELPRAEAVVAAVAHKEFLSRPIDDFASKLTERGAFMDVKAQFDRNALGERGIAVWRL